MNKDQIFELMNNNPVFFLATADGDQPRVRGMFLYKADENGIIFHTGKIKDIHKQLQANPNSELCFYDQKGTQIRVAGQTIMDESIELKNEIMAHPSRAFLRPWIEQHGLEAMAVYRLNAGKAVIWDMKENFLSKNFIDLFEK